MTLDKDKIIRAWKDPQYRATLTPEEQAALPPCPAGDPSMTDAELERIAGGENDGSSNGNSCGWFCTWTCECWCNYSLHGS